MKPKTQSEIDEWNAGARQADAHWADQPHERGAGITYEQARIGGHERNGVIYPVFEQQEVSRGN